MMYLCLFVCLFVHVLDSCCVCMLINAVFVFMYTYEFFDPLAGILKIETSMSTVIVTKMRTWE